MRPRRDDTPSLWWLAVLLIAVLSLPLANLVALLISKPSHPYIAPLCSAARLPADIQQSLGVRSYVPCKAYPFEQDI